MYYVVYWSRGNGKKTFVGTYSSIETARKDAKRLAKEKHAIGIVENEDGSKQWPFYPPQKSMSANTVKKAAKPASASGARASAVFEVGKTYGSARDLGGRFKVISRTPKTVRITYLDDTYLDDRLCKIAVVNGEERIYPMGSGYAGAPIYGVRSKTIDR